jgi:hypothetical protein
MQKALWTTALGSISTAIVIGFWVLVAISWRREVHYPGELGGVMATLVAALALSVAAAAKGSRWWLLAILGSLATIIAVMARLH